jgi:hypothetical protein
VDVRPDRLRGRRLPQLAEKPITSGGRISPDPSISDKRPAVPRDHRMENEVSDSGRSSASRNAQQQIRQGAGADRGYTVMTGYGQRDLPPVDLARQALTTGRARSRSA